MTELTKQLKKARGKRYYDILCLILADVGPQIAADAKDVAIAKGRLTVFDVARLAVKYDLNFKATCEWLEESQVLPVGTYERVESGAISPVMDWAKAIDRKG